MGERPASADAPVSEALATTGLFLNLASFIALAVCLASWGSSDTVWAAAAGVAALLTFASAWTFASINLLAGDHAPAGIVGRAFWLALILFSSSAVVSIFSFLPKLSLPALPRGPHFGSRHQPLFWAAQF